jgi:hypothetical protein
MTLVHKRVTAAVSPASDAGPGEFDIILSTAARDREGEVVAPGSWVMPLPDVIPINANHSSDVSDIVGSGAPWIDADGHLRVRGTFASTPQAQHVRSLVQEGHLRTVSVEMLRRKGVNGEPVNELVGGAFVLLPANPQAIVLSAKAFNDQLEQVIKAASTGADVSAMVRAIHDAATHIDNTVCPAMGYADDDLSEDGESGEDDGANSKALALKLRLKAMARA